MSDLNPYQTPFLDAASSPDALPSHAPRKTVMVFVAGLLAALVICVAIFIATECYGVSRQQGYGEWDAEIRKGYFVAAGFAGFGAGWIGSVFLYRTGRNRLANLTCLVAVAIFVALLAVGIIP